MKLENQLEKIYLYQTTNDLHLRDVLYLQYRDKLLQYTKRILYKMCFYEPIESYESLIYLNFISSINTYSVKKAKIDLSSYIFNKNRLFILNLIRSTSRKNDRYFKYLKSKSIIKNEEPTDEERSEYELKVLKKAKEYIATLPLIQQRIIKLKLENKTNKEIAEELKVKLSYTIHIINLFKKNIQQFKNNN